MDTKTKILAGVTVLIMLTIFMLSAQTVSESSGLSDDVTRFILDILEPGQHTESPKSSKSNSDKRTDSTQSTVTANSSDSMNAEKTKEDLDEKKYVTTFGHNVSDYKPVPKKQWFGIKQSKFTAVVRKSAHFLLFMLLGIFVCNTVISYRKYHNLQTMAFSLLFCATYASLDEFHQLFVKGRGAQIRDVLIDVSGALLGIAAVSVIYQIKRRKNIKVK